MAFSGQQNFPKIQFNVETTNATVTTPTGGTYTVSTNSVGEAEIHVVGRDNVSGEILHGVKIAKFKRVSGTLSVVGSLIDLVTLSIDGTNMLTATWTIDVSGDDIRVRVTGVVGRTIHWQGYGMIIVN